MSQFHPQLASDPQPESTIGHVFVWCGLRRNPTVGLCSTNTRKVGVMKTKPNEMSYSHASWSYLFWLVGGWTLVAYGCRSLENSCDEDDWGLRLMLKGEFIEERDARVYFEAQSSHVHTQHGLAHVKFCHLDDVIEGLKAKFDWTG